MILGSLLRIDSSMAYSFGIEVNDKIEGLVYNPLTDAGEFTFRAVDDGYIWNSYCLEKSVGLPYWSYVGGLSDRTVPTDDVLSDWSAWLFREAMLGSLSGFNNNTQDQHDIQYAIWWEENELASAPSYYDPSTVATWRSAFDASGWINDGQVQVVNMYRDVDLTNHAQDQLILANPVPEPTTVMLFCVGLLGLTYTARKRD